MSMGSQISAFCRGVARKKLFWTIQFEDESLLEWVEEDGHEVLPFWSTQSRVEKALERIDPAGKAYLAFIDYEKFITEWLPEMTKAGMKVGPNWSGENLTGTTFPASELISRIQKQIELDEKNT